ncbi:MAG: GFA family protein [Halioglobus sp.]
MITGSCHCGAISFELDDQPEWLTQCNCSICRRLGTVWAHASVDKVKVQGDPDASLAYTWGDKELAFHTCKNCGSTTHWVACEPKEDAVMAVNTRLVDPEQIAEIRVRQFDGADSWRYLD